MVDTLSKNERSRRMSLIKGRDTKPELRVRSLVHRMGYRFRLHRRSLPGTPDMVFPSRRTVIFVHGCYWHRHEGCHLARLPKSRREFWVPKLEANRRRDMEHQRALAGLGWRVLVVWECEVADSAALAERIRGFLEEEEKKNGGG